MVWTLDQSAYNQADPTAVGTGVTATFSATPTEGDELVAYAIARPDNNSTSTNVLSMSGWTKMAQADTTSHSIAIFHKTAGASEPTGHTLTATMTGDTDMVCALYIQEFSGGTFDTADVVEASNSGGSNVASFSDSTGVLSSQPQLCVAIGTIRASSTGTLTWDGTNRPANDPLASQIPTSGTFAYMARTGWEELTATTARTFEVDSSSSAQGAMVIVAWPEAGGAGGQSVTPTGASVSVTAGTLTVAPGAVAISPTGASVSVTPGTVTVTTSTPITPTGASVSVTPGTVTVTTQTDITPTGASVSVTAGTLDVTQGGGTQNVTPTGASVSVSAGTVTVATSYDVTPVGASASVTPGSVTVTQGINVLPDGASVSVTPGTVTVTTGNVDITPTGATITVTPGTPTFSSATPISPNGASITLTPGTLGVDMAITPNGALVSVTPGTISIAFDQSVSLTGATITVTAGTGNVFDSTNLATDTRYAAVYREPAYADTYQEPAYAARYREEAYAPTYRG